MTCRAGASDHPPGSLEGERLRSRIRRETHEELDWGRGCPKERRWERPWTRGEAAEPRLPINRSRKPLTCTRLIFFPGVSGWKCSKCDMRENLWLNLTDGSILCGRRTASFEYDIFEFSLDQNLLPLHYLKKILSPPLQMKYVFQDVGKRHERRNKY